MMAGHTLVGENVTATILSVFRANGLLLAAGDLLSAGEGLTSARWQVLGAIDGAGRPLTVPQIARQMGLTRQSVHATVKRLIADGLVELVPNADHRRSQLVRMTDAGERRYAAIDKLQIAWANRLAAGIDPSDLETVRRVLDVLSERLATEVEAGSAIRDNGKGWTDATARTR